MSLRRLVQVSVGAGVALLAALLLLSLMAELATQEAAGAESRRSTSLRLAYELRQTSDDLTRMARSYVATGEPRYLGWFEEILRIRAGTAPRPQRYDRIYWDVVSDTGVRPTPFGPPVSLATLAAQAGFNPDELRLLASATQRSDALARIEEQAFALVARGDTGQATAMLYGPDYLRAKNRIMEPIGQVLTLVDDHAVALAVILVVISQVKINSTNAYSGSLAWTNSFTRVTKRYPRRIVFVFVNLAFALTLMEANMFASLNYLLGFCANCAIAWVTTVAADIAINKFWLGISPKEPEFRRAYLYAFNPVGVGSFLLATIASFLAFFGAFGSAWRRSPRSSRW